MEPIKDIFIENGFKFIYAHDISSVWGKAEFDSYIGAHRLQELRNLQGQKKWELQKLMKELLEGPKPELIFDNKALFELDASFVKMKRGYYIYRVGSHDFLVYKE